MVSFKDSLKLSSKLARRILIVETKSVYVTQDKVKGEIVVDSVEVEGTEHVFVEGDIARNKYWVGLVKCSEGQRLVECCCLVYR